ncbi:hypothetical protein Kfla_4616 [Kribbella flavida DSM 17836]|uniref:Uncharacterized protein n=1 Tax=Kribbella flavida (strain DSM 17836 / JCM 10339 / NBRC 14399) TaxID=479435 RepID=D2PY28_KRIFD|nr:hypothetical protein Kfla_4616 [Kribbella flavida DSM 17836]
MVCEVPDRTGAGARSAGRRGGTAGQDTAHTQNGLRTLASPRRPRTSRYRTHARAPPHDRLPIPPPHLAPPLPRPRTPARSPPHTARADVGVGLVRRGTRARTDFRREPRTDCPGSTRSRRRSQSMHLRTLSRRFFPSDELLGPGRSAYFLCPRDPRDAPQHHPLSHYIRHPSPAPPAVPTFPPPLPGVRGVPASMPSPRAAAWCRRRSRRCRGALRPSQLLPLSFLLCVQRRCPAALPAIR